MNIFNACKFMKYSLWFEFAYMRGKSNRKKQQRERPMVASLFLN